MGVQVDEARHDPTRARASIIDLKNAHLDDSAIAALAARLSRRRSSQLHLQSAPAIRPSRNSRSNASPAPPATRSSLPVLTHSASSALGEESCSATRAASRSAACFCWPAPRRRFRLPTMPSDPGGGAALAAGRASLVTSLSVAMPAHLGRGRLLAARRARGARRSIGLRQPVWLGLRSLDFDDRRIRCCVSQASAADGGAAPLPRPPGCWSAPAAASLTTLDASGLFSRVVRISRTSAAARAGIVAHTRAAAGSWRAAARQL